MRLCLTQRNGVAPSRAFSVFAPALDRSGRLTRIRDEHEKAYLALPRITLDQFDAIPNPTIEDARSCLAHLREELIKLDKSKRREKVQEVKAGAKILLWVLNCSREHQIEISRHRMFVDMVCCFVVAEGKEDVVVQWMYSEHESRTPTLVREWGKDWSVNYPQEEED